jgi:hypothetical protein
MIELVKDAEGRMLGVCEYLFVDKDTLMPSGDTIFVGDIYINPQARGMKVLKKIITRLFDSYPEAIRVHFFREKNPNNRGKEYSRAQIGKLIGRIA